jgi:hypothetical protein
MENEPVVRPLFSNLMIVILTEKMAGNAGANNDPLSLEFSYVSGPQVFIDDVTASAIPEPASIGFLALTGSALVLRRRRSQRP